MDNTLFTLLNPEFDFEWNGQVYRVKKANLEKIVLYQERAKQLTENKDLSGEIKLMAYCISLILRDAIPDISENQVMKDAPGDLSFVDIMIRLGFLNTTRMKALLQKATNQTGDSSLSPSQTEPDGLQDKSVS